MAFNYAFYCFKKLLIFRKTIKMTYYESESLYFSCSTTAIERLKRLEQIIIALENQAIIAASNADVSEYSLNDGQVTIRTAYRNMEEIAKAIDRFQAIYNRLKNKCMGTSIVSLRDFRSFNLLQR